MKTLSPRHKLLLAAVALVAVLALGAQATSAATAARLLLGLAAVGALGWWLARGRRGGAKFNLTPRLEVLQRVGLSQRTGLALVEVDGQPLLVVHGEGFARVERMRRSRRDERRPRLVALSGARASEGGRR